MSLSLRSPALIRRRRMKVARRVIFWLFLILLIIAMPLWLSYADFLRIKEIEVIGANTLLASDIKSLAEERLAGKYFFLFPKNNAVLYSKEDIKSSLSKEFTQIDTVELNLSSLNMLEISVEMRKPSALWCRNLDTKLCYFIDNKGLVFEEAGDFSPGVYFIYYGNIEDEVIGALYLSSEEFKNVEAFKAGVRNLSLIPQSISPLSKGSFKLSVSGGDIIFSLRDDITATLSNLASVLADSKLKVVDNQELTVSSIDLRFGNKVILKKGTE